MLNEAEFLSPFGVRALSAHHREHPYVMSVNGYGRYGFRRTIC
jgi:hypothetical protein